MLKQQKVLASIIDRLLVKSPDGRYQSARGLKADLLECQRRLLATVSSTAEESSELIPHFEITTQDRFMDFTVPLTLFGREKELEIVRNVIRNCSASFSTDVAVSNGFKLAGSGNEASDEMTDSHSPHSSVRSDSPMPMEDVSMPAGSASGSGASSLPTTDTLRRAALSTKSRVARTHVVIVVGPPGVGKSSIILANQAKWRGICCVHTTLLLFLIYVSKAHGLWGHAKFLNADASGPFSTLVRYPSVVLCTFSYPAV